jgi:GMP synthase (glutamine-hydrolysing)
MRREGFDPHRTFQQVAATPIARRLLKMFSRHHGLSRGPR